VKKLFLVVAVAALALTLVPLAAAKPGGWKHGKAKFELVGKIVAVDATATDTSAGTVTVKVKSGTKTVRAFRGKEAVMGVVLKAKIRLVTKKGAAVIALADVPVDGKAKIRGTIDRTDPANPVFTVKYLKVKAPRVAPAE
jgi:hypothetical protein